MCIRVHVTTCATAKDNYWLPLLTMYREWLSTREFEGFKERVHEHVASAWHFLCAYELSLTPFKMSQHDDPQWTYEWACRGKKIDPLGLFKLSIETRKQANKVESVVDEVMDNWMIANCEFWELERLLMQINPLVFACHFMVLSDPAKHTPFGSEHAAQEQRQMNIHKKTCRLRMIHRLIR